MGKYKVGDKFIFEITGEYISWDSRTMYQCDNRFPATENTLDKYKKYDPDEKANCWSDGYFDGFDDGKKQAKVQADLDVCHDIENVAKRNYQKGLDDAWEAARKVFGYCHADINDVFYAGDAHVDLSANEMARAALNTLSPSEAISKIREYEEKQKAEQEIKVGDEVAIKPNDIRGVVIECHVPDVYPEVDKYAVFTRSSVEYVIRGWITKTGRRFPQIGEVLKEMGEE